MQLAAKAFKQVFLKHMLLGLRRASPIASLQGRKAAIQLSSNVALAVARGDRRRWPRGLLSRLAQQEERLARPFLKLLLGDDRYRKLIPQSRKITKRSLKLIRSRKTTTIKNVAKKKKKSTENGSALAKCFLAKRMQLLKSLVPGGNSMGGSSLLEETLDYVVFLQWQVNLMRGLVETFQFSNPRAQNKWTLEERKEAEEGEQLN
ncbi:transcription factor IBH1-like 1 [Curcuma longa]|uniref:transcription factor IBH1-like 1 n=1 Tax=Curcuma longa TaxID=136217 RepID=UPI003D9E8863